MITIDDELTSRLKCMENEQNRLNEMLAEVQELEGKIENIKTTMTAHNNEGAISAYNDKEIVSQKLNITLASHSKTDGYVVCLMFNPKSPVEWSGNKWQIHGKGKCYSSSEQASQCLVALQKRWPGYPFQILTRPAETKSISL